MTEPAEEELRSEVGKCISCGFCEAVCPTLPSAGFNLWKGARGRVIMGAQLLESINAGSPDIALSDSFYSCLDCHACLYVCPAEVNAGKVSQLSREIISQRAGKKGNPTARMIVSVTMRKFNPLGIRKKTAQWARGIEFDSNSDTLLYTGNMYQLMSYTANLNKTRKFLGRRTSDVLASIVARFPSISFVFSLRNSRTVEQLFSRSLVSIVALLKKAGLKLKYMGTREPYPGTFLHDLGYAKEFRVYAQKITEMLRNEGIRRIITVDPHTYDLLKFKYPEYVENFDFEVLYYLDLIEKLNFNKTDEDVVFHEPCHFVLRDHNYRKPEMILRKVSNVRLAHRSGKRSECCGGPNELLFPELSESVAERRHNDLVKTGASRIVTSCPICFSNLNRGHKITDVADYLAERVA